MYLAVKPKVDTKGNVLDQISSYNPNVKERERLKDLQRDFQYAQTIRDKSYDEFASGNDESQSLVEFSNKLVKRFNNVIPPVNDDPNQSWRANTIRPLTRNKCISVIAHLTNSVMYPGIIAQNEDSIEDKDFSQVMRDCVEWVDEQSSYDECMINVAYELCYSPAVIIEQGFRKVTKKIKEINDDNTWTFKEVSDERYDGYYSTNVPVEELYIENIYESNIQKQGFLIRVKAISYKEAETKYKDRKNWKYVKPGYVSYFNEETNSFYDSHDEIIDERLVQELFYYNRDADLELVVVNGILLDDPDKPIQRKDKKYPFAKTFYEKINTRFFYGLPLVAKIKPDQDVIDTLYNMIIDGTFLQIFPVLASYGADNIDSSVIAPANVISFKSPTSKIEPLGLNANMANAMNVLAKVENSASESSQDPLQMGQAAQGDRTKYELQRLEMNAKTVLGLAGKAIGSIVKQFGDLVVGSIVQYMPLAQIMELTDDEAPLKFPKIFRPEKKGEENGRLVEFTTEMPQTPVEEENMGWEMLKEEESKNYSIIKVNPKIFRRLKYLTKVEPEFSDATSKFFKKLQLYDRAIANPYCDQEVVTKKLLLNAYVPGEEDQFIKKQTPGNPIEQALASQNKKTSVTQISTPTPEMEVA